MGYAAPAAAAVERPDGGRGHGSGMEGSTRGARPQDRHGPSWMLWQRGVYSVAFRILLVWIYNNTGSLFATTLFHAMDNVQLVALSPIRLPLRSGGNRAVSAIIAAAVTYL